VLLLAVYFSGQESLRALGRLAFDSATVIKTMLTKANKFDDASELLDVF